MRRFFLGVAVTGAALGAQWLLWPSIHASPFLLATLAVVVSAWTGGWAAGLASTVITALAANYLFFEPPMHFGTGRRALFTMAMFAVVGLLSTWLVATREHAIRATRAQRSWLDTTLQSIADGVIVTDQRGDVTFINEVAAALTGWSAAAARGRPVGEVFRVCDAASGTLVESPIVRALRDGRVVELENHTRLVSRAGGRAIIEDSGAPIRGAGGRVLGAVLVFRDASKSWRETERRNMLADIARVLASSLDYDATLREAAHLAVPRFADWCAVHLVDESGALRVVAIAHADPEKVRFAEELERRYPQDWSATAGLPAVFRTGKSRLAETITGAVLDRVSRDAEHRRLLGELGLTSYIATPLAARGRTLGTLTFVTAESRRHYQPSDVPFAEDLAARAAMAVDNARLYLEAQEAVRLRDEFLAVASHELRTPLTTLQLQLEMLERAIGNGRDGSGRVARGVDSVRRQATRLAQLVESMLDVSRITTGRLGLEREEVDLADLAAAVIDRMRPNARAAGCELVLEATGEEAHGRWDRSRLEQVLGNLLSNAFKYGAGRPVRVTVSAERGVARLAVRDHGIGIASRDVERIFGRFERAVSPRHYGGLGLGLYIARQIAEAHGGEIRVWSRPHKGSEFTVVLPAHAPEVRAGPLPPPLH